jgi:hypothetical protein
LYIIFLEWLHEVTITISESDVVNECRGTSTQWVRDLVALDVDRRQFVSKSMHFVVPEEMVDFNSNSSEGATVRLCISSHVATVSNHSNEVSSSRVGEEVDLSSNAVAAHSNNVNRIKSAVRL